VDRRRFFKAGLALGASALVGPLVNRGRLSLAAGLPDISTHALDLVNSSVVLDMLGLFTLSWGRLARWQREPASIDSRHLRWLKAAGVTVYHHAVELNHPQPYQAALRSFARWNELLSGQPCFLTRVDSLASVLRLSQTGEVGVILGLQNSTHLRSVADVALFFGLGQRVSQLTYDETNRLGSGCRAGRDRGLTRFGSEVVTEMNRVGMAIDVSHCGDRTSLDAALLSRRPVLATHTNCRALVPHQPRCKPDEVIRGIAAGGGVIGVTLVRNLVAASAPSLDDVLDHFVHVARLVGVEHVGLGSDVSLDAVDPVSGRPLPSYDIAGLHPAIRVYQLTDGLLRRGFGKRDIELILGGNFLRALAWIWPDKPLPPLADPWLERRDPFCPPVPLGGI